MVWFARIENDKVVELLEADKLPQFHPSLEWVECDTSVKEGHVRQGARLVQSPTPPTPQRKPPETDVLLRALKNKLNLTPSEIEAARLELTNELN